jgi:Domain of unknown function (DUF4268)
VAGPAEQLKVLHFVATAVNVVDVRIRPAAHFTTPAIAGDYGFANRTEIEQIVGEPLEWERLNDRRACRIALYTKAQILTDAESPVLLEWAAQESH